MQTMAFPVDFIACHILNDAGHVVLPSALSDAAGDYTLKVTDVLTGATAEAKISLK